MCERAPGRDSHGPVLSVMRLELRNGVAVVTGAASGIGRATALALASRGCHLALADRNVAGLEETVGAAGAFGVRVSSHPFDVADAEAVAGFPGAVLEQHDKVSILINNAGVALMGRFEELTLAEYRWLIEINFLAVVGLTKAFLPVLRRERAAQIVNLSSLFGIVAPINETAYSASKFAVRGFSESLRHELEGSGIGVTVVHPGGVRTGIATSARVAAAADQVAAVRLAEMATEKLLRMPPERAAAAILEAIERREPRLILGADAWVVTMLQRVAPVRYWSIMKRFLPDLG